MGIAPFAKHRGKIYPIPLTDELIGLLNETYGRVFIFGGGEHEKSFAEGMEKRHPGVVSVIGRMSMSQEMDLISNHHHHHQERCVAISQVGAAPSLPTCK